MKAIILAAGKGTRLNKITAKKPKALVNVNSKPILQYQIEALLANNIQEITVCAGYKADQIKKFCEEKFKDTVKIIENKEYETTNNMYSLKLALDFEEDVIIINGDVVFDKEIIQNILQKEGTVFPVEKGAYNEESMKIKVNPEGQITDIAKTITDGYGCSIDIYKLIKPDAIKVREELTRIIDHQKEKNMWTEVMLQGLLREGKIVAKPFDIGSLRWFEIDNFEDLYNAEILFNEKLTELKQKSLFLLDRDGTLLMGESLISGAKEFLGHLKKREKEFSIFTNNSSKTPKRHIEDFAQHELPVEDKNFLISTDALMRHLKNKSIEKIHLVANKEVSNYFQECGFFLPDENPQAVVLTYDNQINYEKLVNVCKLINKGIPYFATHDDELCPTPEGFIPDIGTFIKLIETTTGKMPEKTFGKPSNALIENIVKEKSAIVGDRLYTDIKMGKNSGMLSILVLSGETKREDVEFSEIKPDIIVRNINDLSRFI